MASSIQAKAQLLGVLSAVFLLFSVPLFNQLITDARDDSSKWYHNTWMDKEFAKVAKNLKAKNTGDVVIDSYQDYEKELRKKIPDCGEACNADADLDQDGRSNKFEYDNPEVWNAYCNEEERGHGNVTEGQRICRGEDPIPTKTTTPPPKKVHIPPLTVKLFEGNFTDQDVPRVFGAPSPQDGNGGYDQWTVNWTATGLTSNINQAYSLTLIPRDSAGPRYCCDNRQVPPLQDQDVWGQTLNRTNGDLPEPGDYRISGSTGNNVSPASPATFHVTIIGTRFAFEKTIPGGNP